MLVENGTAVRVNNVLLVWDNITTPDEKYNRYNGKFLISKGDAQSVEELVSLCRKVQQTDKVPLTSQFNANDPKHDGDCYYNKNGELVEQYKGHWVVNAGSGKPIPVIDESGCPVDLNMQKPLYNGIGLNVIFNAYARRADGNVGTSLGVMAIQIADRNKPRLFEGSGGSVSHSQAAGMFGSSPTGGVATPSPVPQQAAPVAAPAPSPAPAPAAAERWTPVSPQAIASPDHKAWLAQGWTEDALVSNGHFTRAM